MTASMPASPRSSGRVTGSPSSDATVHRASGQRRAAASTSEWRRRCSGDPSGVGSRSGQHQDALAGHRVAPPDDRARLDPPALGRAPVEHRPPASTEQAPVALDPRAVDTAAARGAAHVFDHRSRLIDHASRPRGEREAEIDVLAVDGRKPGIESTHRDECGAAHEQAGRRRVVDGSPKVVLGPVGDIAVAVLTDPRVAPDDRTRLLEAPVRVEQLRGNGRTPSSASATSINGPSQSGSDPRVAVEQQQVTASCHGGPLVVGGAEPEVARIAQDPGAAHLGRAGRRCRRSTRCRRSRARSAAR